jgi:hypothetical protein
VNLTAIVVAVVDEQAGAIATFLGTVRAQSRGRDVIALEYEAYQEMAEDVMAQIAAEVDERYDLRKGRSRIDWAVWRSERQALRSPSPRRTGRMRSPLARTSSRR